MRATRRCTVIASAPVNTTRLPDGKLRVSDAATASARPAGRGGRPGPDLARCGRSEDHPVRSSAPILTERTPSLEAIPKTVDERLVVDRPGVRGALAQRLPVWLAGPPEVGLGDRRE